MSRGFFWNTASDLNRPCRLLEVRERHGKTAGNHIVQIDEKDFHREDVFSFDNDFDIRRAACKIVPVEHRSDHRRKTCGIAASGVEGFSLRDKEFGGEGKEVQFDLIQVVGFAVIDGRRAGSIGEKVIPVVLTDQALNGTGRIDARVEMAFFGDVVRKRHSSALQKAFRLLSSKSFVGKSCRNILWHFCSQKHSNANYTDSQFLYGYSRKHHSSPL